MSGERDAGRTSIAPQTPVADGDWERKLAALLAAYRKPLQPHDVAPGGEIVAGPSSHDLPAEQAHRLRAARACLRLLEKVWPPGSSAGNGGLLDTRSADHPRPEETDAQDLLGDRRAAPPAWHSEEFQGTDRFPIRRSLGRGGMGVVYEVFDRQRHQSVALKTMRHADPAALYYFKHEFRALADVHHPNLAALHELFCAGELWFFTMELIEGPNLPAYVRGQPPGASGVNQPLHTAAQFFRLRHALRQLGTGLCALHESGKLHRDVKPSNVLVTRSDRVVLLDFGLAKEFDWRHLEASTEQHAVGTLRYMAPEQAACQPLSPASDWYSVGVMLYELLTGSHPYLSNWLEVLQGKPTVAPPAPRDVVTGVPEDLNALCLDLLASRPEARPSGREVLQRLGPPPADLATAELPPAAPTPRVPFVGRAAQLAALTDAYLLMRQGQTVTIHVHGRSGLGKTALIQRFLEDLQDREDVVVLTGRCYERETVPYKAVDSLVDALTHYLRGRSPLEVQVVLPRDVAPLVRVFPVLRRVSAIEQAAVRSRGEISDQQELRRRAFGALRELLTRLGDRHPLILFVDDLQWGDLDSAALLNDLLRPPDPPTLLLVGSYRSEDAKKSPCLGALLQAPAARNEVLQRRILCVEALSDAEAEDLALRLLGEQGEGRGPAVEAETPSQAAAIARESAGNPFFVYELVRYYRGGASGASSAGEPITLETVLASRIEKLSEPARRLLEIIAVAGRPVGHCDAFRAAATEPEERAALASLLAARLIRTARHEDRDEVEMYHDRIRETMTVRLPTKTLQAHHRALAMALEASGADAEFLAEHWDAAEDWDKAAHYYALAADRAAEALAFERAVQLYRRALQGRAADDPHWAPLQTQLGDALGNAGRGAEAAAAYLLAAQDAPLAESRDLMRRAGFQYCISGHLDEGRAAFRRILGEIGLRLPTTRGGTLAALLFFRARLRLRGLRFKLRREADLSERERMRLDITESVAMGCSTNSPWHGALFQTRNLLLALRSGDPVRIALALSWEAAYHSLVGQPGWRRTEQLLELAQSLATQTQDPHALGSACLALGTAEFLRGRYQVALEHNDRAERIFRDHCTGVIWEQDTAQIFGLWSLFYMGRIEHLRGRYDRVFKEAQQRGDRYLMTTLGTQVGTLLLLVDDRPQAARESLDDLMSRWTHDGFTVQHHNEFFARQAIDLYEGRLDSALQRLQAVAHRYRRSLLLRIQHIRIDLAQLQARCYLAAAEREPAGRHRWLVRAASCLQKIRRERMPWGLALASFLQVRADIAVGRSTAAVAGLEQAAIRLDESQHVLLARVADWQRGQLLGGQGGHALTDSALDWFQEQGVRNPQGLLRMVLAFLDSGSCRLLTRQESQEQNGKDKIHTGG